MIHLKLRQAGELINYKRVERLYGLEKVHIRRRRAGGPAGRRVLAAQACSVM